MDPERPIEKLLRQAAEARRTQAGTPQELHLANRRMLQSEIARKFASAVPHRRSFFELYMPRLAWSAAVIVGVGLAASLMLPRKNPPRQEMLFAKNDRVTGTANEPKPASASAASESLAQSQVVAPSEQRVDSSALAAANSARLADAERDKDSVSLERRRVEPERSQPLAMNEPAATPPQPLPREEGRREGEGTVRQPTDAQLHTATSTAGGSLAVAKQKEQLADRYATATPPQTPVTEEKMVQRRYGLAGPAQSSPPPAASAGTAGVGASTAMKLNDETAKAEHANKSVPTAAAPASSSLGVQLKSAASADLTKRSPAPVAQATQKFVQATLNKTLELAQKSTISKPILFSFELQQLGREVRIIDSDGSVYSGSFQPPETFNELDSTVSEKAAVTRSLQTTEAQAERKKGLADSKLPIDMSYSFKVSGTNQTLKQIVTFTGEVLAPTNALSLIGPAGTVNGNRTAELHPLPLQNSRVSGKAVIGTNNEVEVNAIPSH